jgi:hypothetical protein
MPLSIKITTVKDLPDVNYLLADKGKTSTMIIVLENGI